MNETYFGIVPNLKLILSLLKYSPTKLQLIIMLSFLAFIPNK